MKSLKISLLCSVCLLILIISCRKDSDNYDNPELVLSEDTLTFFNDETKSIFISTQPTSECEYRVISSPDWIDVFPDSGIIKNNIKELAVTSWFDQYEPAEYSGEIVIMSTAGSYSIVLVGEVGNQLKYYFPDMLIFTIFNDSLSLIIENEGNIDFEFDAITSNNNILMQATSGEIKVNQQTSIPIVVNRDLLETGTYNSEIFITIDGIVDTVDIVIENFKEQKIKLTSDVVDAEYSKDKDMLFFVSSTPSQFNTFNPATNSIESVSLTYTPTCLSISPDGETAVVGHDGHITVIDLNPLSVLKTTYASCQAFDIVLSANNWAYVFPEEDQWVKIKCIDIETGIETESDGYNIYENTRARLHPDGKYIYTAEDDLEKFDITEGTAVYMYDSPYHSDYPIYNNLWYSEDGIRIFTEGGSVFRTSEIQQNDMLYNGSIELGGPSYYNQIVWLDHSSTSSNLFVLRTGEGYDDPNKPNVLIFNATNLVYKSELKLEDFLILNNYGGGSFYKPEPYFVFANSSEQEVYVIVKAIGSGMLHEWGIQKIEY
jgi:hypothetical protein